MKEEERPPVAWFWGAIIVGLVVIVALVLIPPPSEEDDDDGGYVPTAYYEASVMNVTGPPGTDYVPLTSTIYTKASAGGTEFDVVYAHTGGNATVYLSSHLAGPVGIADEGSGNWIEPAISVTWTCSCHPNRSHDFPVNKAINLVPLSPGETVDLHIRMDFNEDAWRLVDGYDSRSWTFTFPENRPHGGDVLSLTVIVYRGDWP